MWKAVQNRGKIEIVCMAMFVLILSSASIPRGSGASSSATVAVVPQTLSVEAGVPFTINVTVSNVTGMFGWQIKVFFNAAILNCTAATYPSDHVFAGKQFVPVSAMIEANYVLFGATLYYEQDVFTGNGRLCQITFIGKAVGNSTLQFDAESTYLLDYDLSPIGATLVPGSVNVIPEFSPWLIAPLLIITTLVAAAFSKIAWSKKQPKLAH